jgi:SAM-dependent methyltransferase
VSERLNIGASQTRLDGFTNIDIAPWADVSIDIGTEPLPFDDDSVDLVFSYHTLEHVPDYLFALGEIHRVLKHGAPFLVGLPYVTLTEVHLVNPYHLHNFNEWSFDFFEKGKLRDSAAETVLRRPIEFKKAFHRMHYIGLPHLFPERGKRWARRHFFNVVRKIDFGLVAVKDDRPVTFDRTALEQDFVRLLRSREPYKPRTRPAPTLSDWQARKKQFRVWWTGRDD